MPGVPYDITNVDGDDSGFGLWLNAGFSYTIGSHFNIGLDLRYSDASVDLATGDELPDLGLDAGGIRYGAMFGYHW
jgi:hypothetical protein